MVGGPRLRNEPKGSVVMVVRVTAIRRAMQRQTATRSRYETALRADTKTMRIGLPVDVGRANNPNGTWWDSLGQATTGKEAFVVRRTAGGRTPTPHRIPPKVAIDYERRSHPRGRTRSGHRNGSNDSVVVARTGSEGGRHRNRTRVRPCGGGRSVCREGVHD